MKVLSSLRVEVLVKIFLIHLSTESSAAAEVAGTSLVATIIRYYCEAQARVRQGSARDGKGWPLRRKALKLKTLA